MKMPAISNSSKSLAGMLLLALFALSRQWCDTSAGPWRPHVNCVLAAVADIYPDPSQGKAQIASALAQARREKKRVILDFGGNWCPDCHVLDIYFHDPNNSALLAANFVLVHVNIGYYDQNLDLAGRYGIPLKKGVPALAVLSRDGRVLYSQRNGEFEAMGRMDSAAVTGFLTKWKP